MRQPKKIPGIENRQRFDRRGRVYWTFRVRWIDPGSGRRVGQEFDTQQDAMDFKAQLRLAARRGTLADLTAGSETLADYTAHWWETFAPQNLAHHTLTVYAIVWNVHLEPRLGGLQLRQITPGTVVSFRTDLEAAGVGAPTVRKAMSLLQSILRRAVEEDRLISNPVKHVRKPAQARSRAVKPLPPETVEQIRRALRDMTDQTLISVLAYAGLRPEEALALQWSHVRKGTLLIEQKNVDGAIVTGQKVLGRHARTVDLLDELRLDLAAYRLASGRPAARVYVFRRADDQPWRATDYRNWRKRTFRTAAHTAGLTTTTPPWSKANAYDGPVPYDLRHSFASLLLHEGRLSVVEIAGQMGHSVETLLSTYAHVIAELRGQQKIAANQQIIQARGIRHRSAG